MREQHETCWRLVGIELCEESVEHFCLAHAFISARKISAIAPVLECAEEEDFHAELARLFDNGKDIRLFHRARIDPLLALYGRKRSNTIAQPRRALEFQRLGRLTHFASQMLAHGAAFARKKITRFIGERRIIVLRNLARARPCATLDLIQETGARAVLVIGIRTRAQQKGALQSVQCAIDCPDTRKGTEIIALARARTAMFRQLWRIVIAGQQNIRKRLVVAHQHIEARLHLLDVIGFQQQRFRLGRSRDKNHRAGERNHPRNAAIMAAASRIRGDALFHALRLADIEHFALSRDHPVDARPRRRIAQIGFDDIRTALEGSRQRLAFCRQIERPR